MGWRERGKVTRAGNEMRECRINYKDCHPERSEGPLLDQKCVPVVGVPRFARDDNLQGEKRTARPSSHGSVTRLQLSLPPDLPQIPSSCRMAAMPSSPAVPLPPFLSDAALPVGVAWQTSCRPSYSL